MKNCTLPGSTCRESHSILKWSNQVFPYLERKWGKTLVLMLFLCLFFNQQSFAQDFPEQCVSQDLLVVDAELVFEDPCLNCEEGDILHPTLNLGIENKTGSDRPTFAFWGTLIVSDAQGNELRREPISGCNDEEGLPANTTTYIPFGQIEYVCGDGLKIIDLHLAWTDASSSGKNACDLDPATINPKCGTLTEIVVRPPLFASVLDKDNVVCKGDDNGSIDLYVNGGDQPYNFDWADLAGTNDPQDRTGLAPGTYSVTVTDANGCFRDINGIVITEPEKEVVVTASGEGISCYGEDDGSITVSASGHTRLELWRDGAVVTGAVLSDGVYNDLAPGTYVVKAFADGGNDEEDACTDESEPIVIDEPDELIISLEADSILCYEGTTSLDLTISGGTAPYTVEWSDISEDNDPEDRLEVSSGTYSVTVTDALGCTIGSSIEIDEPAILAATVTSVNVSCHGSSDGSISISTPTGGSGNYQFSIDGTTWQDELVFADLGAGIFDVFIRDAEAVDCVVLLEDDLEIEAPAILAATVTSVDVSCYDRSDGSITISSPTGGSGAYEFSIDGTNWQEGLVFANLSAGIYDVYIRDAEATECIITIVNDLEIDEPAVLAATVTSEDITCHSGSGSITVSAPTGGSGNYEYSLGGTIWVSDPVFTNLSAGLYDVYIRDAEAVTCVILLEDDLEIEAPAILAATVTSVDVSCYDGSDGSITISSPTGGSGTYEFSIDGTTWQDGLVFANLSAGIYDVYIRDAEATECVITIANDLEIDEPAVLAATVTSANISCYGDSDGTITISAPTGGSGSYEFSIDGTTWQGDLVFAGLNVGGYEVYIRDAKSTECYIELGSQVIDQPEVLHAQFGSSDVTCYGDSDGTITFSNPTGGSGNYEYSIDGGASWQTENIFTGLAPGEYPVSVKDAASETCIVDQGFVYIYQPDELLASVKTITDATCSGSANGAIDISVTGGAAPYRYVWSTGAVTEDLSNISAGTYSVEITDANGCIVMLDEIEVEDPSTLEATVDEVTAASCYGNADGSIDISVTGGTAPYTFDWSNDAVTEDLDGIIAGTYSVTITDAKDCSVTLSGIVVGQPNALVVDTEVRNVTCFGGSDGQISITVSGGTPPYDLGWTVLEEEGSVVWDNLPVGNYGVTVIDSKSCGIAIDDIPVSQPDRLASPDYELTQPDCDTPYGSLEITSSTEGLNLHLVLIEGDALLIIEDFTQLEAGNYELSVSNSDGCYAESISFVINDPLNVPDVPEIVVPSIDCFAETGSIAITSDTEGVEFRIDNRGGWFTYTGPIDVAPGVHTIVARNAETLCESEALDFTISPLPDSPVTPVVDAIQPTCEVLTGTIIVTSRIDGYQFFVSLVEDLPFVDPLYVDYPVGGFGGLAPGEYAVFAISEDQCESGMARIVLHEATDCEEFEGCTLGYWKNHTDRWCDEYQTCTAYGEVFEDAPAELADLTLLQVLNLGGGGIYNLGRQSVAALLNACSDEVEFELETTAEVIDYVNANFLNAGSAGSYLDMLNNAGCTLGGSRATSAPSEGCDDEVDSGNGNNGNNGRGDKGKGKNSQANSDISTFPVPFKETVNVQYDFDYSSDVQIDVFDMRGNHLRTYTDRNVTKGSVTRLQVDFVMKANQMYVLKVKTDREIFVKQIISSKK